MSNRSRYDRWPQLLRECAMALDEAAALRLASTLGGQRIIIARRKSDVLIAAVGEAITDFLLTQHTDENLYIPMFESKMLAERRRLHVLQNPRQSANDLARELGISCRRVEQIRHDSAMDPRQPSLFD